MDPNSMGIMAGDDRARSSEGAERLNTLARRYQVPGAQLVVHRPHSEISRTFGCADVNGGSRVDRDSHFPFGSVTKMFTATVAIQLAADGDLDVDAPLAELLPEIATAAWATATPRQLLSHTGGMVSDHEFSGPRGCWADCANTPIVAAAGLLFSYSNTGYVVLGRLIEVVTGYTWHEAVEAFVARPIGANLSFTDLGDRWSSVSGHAVSERVVVPTDVAVPPGWAPAGGIAGPAGALVRLAELLSGRGPAGVLDTTAAATMRRAMPGADPVGLAEGWGLGVASYADGWCGHDGTLEGTSCHVRFHPVAGISVALTTNASSGMAMWHALWPELLRDFGMAHGTPPRRHPQGSFDGALSGYFGEYRNGGTVFTVTAGGGGGLLMQDGSGFRAQLRPLGNDMFVSSLGEIDQMGRFLRDSGGCVIALQFSGRVAGRVGDCQGPVTDVPNHAPPCATQGTQV